MRRISQQVCKTQSQTESNSLFTRQVQWLKVAIVFSRPDDELLTNASVQFYIGGTWNQGCCSTAGDTATPSAKLRTTFLWQCVCCERCICMCIFI